MSDQPANPILDLLRDIRATQAQHTAVLTQHTAVLARLNRRVLATLFDITRIRRENAGDAETMLSTIMDLDERVSRLEQAARERS